MNTLSAIGVCIIATCFYFAASQKLLGAMQQSGYTNKRYLKWLKNKENLFFSRLSLWSGLTILSSAIVALCFSPLGKITAQLISAIPFLLFCALFLIADGKYALKVALKKTKRIHRLSAVYILFIACISYILIALLYLIGRVVDVELYTIVEYSFYGIMPMLLPFILAMANGIESIFENAHNKKFVKKAGQVLNKSEIIRVGIVGSYGKTSVKNILATILAEKYSVVMTPESYNTPIGIAKTVMSSDFTDKQVFIAEMGARKEGDIKELSNLVNPDFAIFTGICEQHIETFLSIDNIFKTKSEIIEDTKNIVVCGSSLKERIESLSSNQKEKCLIAEFDFIIKQANYSAERTNFELCLPGLTPIKVECKLLGKTAAENISIAAMLAYKMGLSKEEIENGIKKLEQIPHRLYHFISDGVHILDDGYNCNILGAAESIAALRKFSARKIVVTPGIVETGVLNEEINGKLGALLLDLDEVLLIGDTLVGAVKKGYLDAGGDESKIHVFKTLSMAKEYFGSILKEGDAILFLSDLPDVY